MKVLILGGSGYIGRHLAHHLAAAGLRPLAASRHDAPLRLDACDGAALTEALRRCDAVVNAVAGSAHAIAEGARVLARAVQQAGGVPVVHLSSLAVHEWDDDGDGPAWAITPHARYVHAKRAAEAHLAALARTGTPVAVLRPGCVWGPGSPLWVNRIADLLAAGRLGDLGPAGDGWTQGVHVRDLCEAVLRLLRPARGRSVLHGHPQARETRETLEVRETHAAERKPPGPVEALRVFDLAAPDSPRWNRYLRDLALAIGATPLRRIPPWQLALDAWVAGPPLYMAQRLARGGPPRGRGQAGDREGSGQSRATGRWPTPLPPSLLRLMRSPARADSVEATRALGLVWTSYERTLDEAAASWRASRPDIASRNARARNSGLPAR